MVTRLAGWQLKKVLEPETLGFKTTDEITAASGIIGQERAAEALSFGLAVKMKGYNIYVMGASGSGRTTFSKEFAETLAKTEPVPPDLCYIYNFESPKEPKILKLLPGQGNQLAKDMDELLERLDYELPRVFNAKDVELKRTEILKRHQQNREELLKEMTEQARQQNFGVKTTNSGIYFMPIVDGEIISEEQYDELSQEQKDDISKNSEAIQAGAAEAMRMIKDWEKNTRKEVDELEYSLGLFEVGRHIGVLLERYSDNDEILGFLRAVKEDILDNITEFLQEDEEEEDSMQALLPWYSKKSGEEVFTKYKINVLTDNSKATSAPVVVDFNPTYSNLVGEVEYDNEYGNLVTDFLKIKPGILHKANGGYLILQAHDVLMNVQVWETLRRVLKTGEVVTEPLREYTTGLALAGIKPQPVPIDVKVILIGSYFYHELLSEYDDCFGKLFKMTADFDYEMKDSRENIKEIAGFIKRFSDRENTLPFEASAVAKVIEYAMRLAERQDRLTTCFNQIEQVLAESTVWAGMGKTAAETITAADVEKAIRQRDYRLSMYEDKLSEMIEKDIIMINTAGRRVGQINGLAVLQTNEYIFAKPTRITATSYVGKAGIVNIEKEAEMSGSIHDKGIQVIIGFLGQTYAQDFPLSLSCRICFEQNYNGIDGDSASSTELYAVLSSLSGLPINQEIAVTGSINQYGDIQPIGGVTYKIEGFFDLCNKRELTGNQGVIIPRQNIGDLVLKDEVVEAVRNENFHIYAIDHVDEGIEILTGVAAGVRNEKGKYPADSVHGMAMRKLKDFYRKALVD